MYQTTEEYAALVMEGSRKVKAKLVIGGAEIDSRKIRKIDVRYSSNSESVFMIGSAAASYADIETDALAAEVEGKSIEAYIGFEGTEEYVPMGLFTAEKPERSEDGVQFKAYDNMLKTEKAYFPNVQNQTDTVEVLGDISAQCGVTIITEGLARLPMTRPEGYTCREVLSYVAQMYGGFAVCDRTGNIRIKCYESTEYEIRTDRYWDAFDHADYLYEFGKITCATGTDEDGNDVTITAGSGSRSMQISNPFMTEAALKNAYGVLQGFSYMPGGPVDVFGDPRIDCWDVLTVYDRNGSSFVVPAMRVEMVYDGGLYTQIEAVGESETEEEQSFTGPARKQMDRYYADMVIIRKALIDKLDVESADIRYAKVTDLEAISIEVESIKGSQAEFETLATQRLDTAEANITSLSGDYAAFKELTASNLTAAVGRIDALQGDLANYKVVVADELTAAKGWMLEGSIGSAQISSLDVNKLNAGTIDTAVIRLASTDSALIVTGAQILVNDVTDASNPFNRVTLGKYQDTDGTWKYGLLVRSGDGMTVMIDGNGVHNAGITDGAVDNSKVADNANISGTKLDIASVVAQINEGDTYISQTVIQVGERTLDVYLAEYSQSVTDLSEELTTQSAKIAANESAISLRVTTQEYNEYKEEAGGQIETISRSLSDAETDINLLRGQISLKVEQTDIQEAVGNIDISSRNLLCNSKTLVGDNYGFVNGSGDDGTEAALLDENEEVLHEENGIMLVSETGSRQVITDVDSTDSLSPQDSLLANKDGKLRQIKKQDLLDGMGLPENIVLFEETEDDDQLLVNDLVMNAVKNLTFTMEDENTLALSLGSVALTKISIANALFARIPCESVTLNRTAIEGSAIFASQVFLITSVEPYNTTDTVKWQTTDSRIAAVEDGVVETQLTIGECDILARCGNHTATCHVSLTMPVFTFEIGWINESGDSADTQNMRVRSNLVNLPAGATLRFLNTSKYVYQIWVYDIYTGAFKQSTGSTWLTGATYSITEDAGVRILVREQNYASFATYPENLAAVNNGWVTISV